MADAHKYQAHEVLNRVLNAGEDGLNVDLADSVTVTVDSEFPAAAAITDNFSNPTTTSAMSMLMGWDTSTWDRVQIGDGTAASALRVTISTNDSHFGAVGAASDVDGVIHGQLRYIGAGVDTVETSANAIQTAVEAVNQAAEGTISSTTQRVTIATDDDGVAHLATIAGAVSTQMQVDVVAISAQSDGTYIGDIKFGESLPAGSNTIGKVDLGTTDNAVLDAIDAVLDTIKVDTEAIETAVELIDDTVAVLGTATYSETSTKGNVVGVVRNDTLAALAGTDNEIAPLQVNKSGALYTVEETGQLGSIFENATTAYSSKQIIAIQFLEDTKFTTLTTDSTIFPGTHADDNGIQIDNNDVFPQGMTIFGKWTAFTLASGSVIAYQGAW